ncbi:MAG: FdhF/YdeP family oxidoreductase [Dehalococcoidia bacterium]|nr:FdhF/YdeP family oxidoreductase [Dehalococcoidia bacterium]
MAKPRMRAAGGLPAMLYVLKKGRESGSMLGLYRRLKSRNACKTCALGMGGQRGGMVNERGHFPEVCKKSVQAQAGDMGAFLTEAWFRRTPIAALASWTPRELEKAGRLTFPVIAEEGDTQYRRLSWQEALDRAGDALRTTRPERAFVYASGRSSNEAAFLLQLVGRAYGTGNIHNCSYYCHNASAVALTGVYGSTAGSVQLDDVEEADLALVAGANPASNHPRLVTQLIRLRERGGRVIVVNPLRELGLERFRLPSDPKSLLFSSKVSDLYLQPHIGSDGVLFQAILKGLIESEAIDRAFIDQYTDGWEAVRAAAEAARWPELTAACGVPKAQIDQAVAMIASSQRGIFMWAMGLTHHANGVSAIESLSNVALARGWLGRPGCGLLPIRGHSNVQGVGSVGVSPGLKEAFAQRLEALYGIAPVAPGQDTLASMEAAAAGAIDAALLLGGNLFGSNPDREWAGAALRNIPVTVAITTKLNEGHIHGRGRTSIILPALARDEESQATTQESMFSYVRLSEGGEPAVAGQMRSEVEIIAAIAERILQEGRFDWAALRSHRELREAMAKVVPGYEAIGRIDDTKQEFAVQGRSFAEPIFPTPNGRAQFAAGAPSAFDPGPGRYRLMTLRSEGQFNTVVYDEEDIYRGNQRRDVVMMAARDARELGLREGDRVVVESDAGSMEASVAVVAIRAGNLAMYYPEANVLVPRGVDARSRTPAFKSVAVTVRHA